jgi:thiol-disulfide isomerase/thioredoxin
MNLRAWFLCSLTLLLSVFIISCGNDDQKHPNEFVIKGKLKNSKGELFRLQLLTVDSLCPIDSAEIDDNGEFVFRAKIDVPGFYILGTGTDNFITLLPDKGEDISLTGDAMQLANDYDVSGSPGSMLLWELNEHTRYNYRKSDSLLNVNNTSQISPKYDSIKHLVDSSLNLVFVDQKKFVKDFIQKNPESLASLMALYQIFGQLQVVSEKEDFALYEMLDQNLSAKYPTNGYVAELHKRVDVLKKDEAERKIRETRLDSGNVAPDIDLKTAAGYPMKLSSLRGRIVLLHFWAGWSAPSQLDISFYKFLNKKYGPKGFTIFSVSLDKDRQTWEMSIRENKLSWIQVSDLLEWKSPVVKDYNITSIPVTFLLDRNGKILCKRPDQQTLANYLYRIYKF